MTHSTRCSSSQRFSRAAWAASEAKCRSESLDNTIAAVAAGTVYLHDDLIEQLARLAASESRWADLSLAWDAEVAS
jgi:hypothetical protein